MNRRTPLLIVLLAALSGHSSAGDAAADSLFERLGGNARVNAIVEATVSELAASSRDAFGTRDPQAVKHDLVRRICAVAGGGCRYRGPDDTGAELVEALRISMRTHGVPLAARNELLEALTPARDRASVAALNPRK
jgi:hypothetical protein